MRKRIKILFGVCALAACLCFGAACASVETLEGDPSNIPVYDGQHGSTTTPGGEEEPELPSNDPIVLDGVLDEDIYEENAWMDYTTKNTDGEGLGTSEINVRGTMVYGEEGFYVAFDVSNSFVFVDLEHDRWLFYDSGVSVYIGFPGSTTHDYEICLIPDGAVRVASYIQSGYVDIELNGIVSAGTVKGGEINTYDADGYYIETYFPWSAFGLTEAPCAVQMDVAVVQSSSANIEGRDGWESLGLSYKTGWQWANPASWWTWGSGGFGVAPLDITIGEYDTEMGSVSLGAESYSALEDVVINIAPGSGYSISSVLVNGTEMRDAVANNVLTLTDYSGTKALNIEVTFIAVSDIRVEVSGTAMAVAGASEAWNIPAGSVITFTSDAGAFSAEIGADGTYTAQLPYGTFSATVSGYSAQTVTVEEGSQSMTQDLQLRYDLLGTSAEYTVGDDESTATATVAERLLTVNASAQQFSLSFTVRPKSGGTGSAGLMILFADSSTSDTNFSFQAGQIDGGYALRMTNLNGWNGAYNLGISEAEYEENGIDVLVICDGNTYTAFYRLLDGAWVEAVSWTQTGVTGYSLFSWDTNTYFTDIAYAPSYDLVTIDADISAQYGSVTLADEYIIGEDVVLNIAPQSGFALGSITVNGTDMTEAVSGGTLTVENCGSETLTVVATFIPEAGEMYEVSGTATAVAGASSAWSLPDGTTLTFTGSITQNVTVQDGKYSVELPNGEIVVSVYGYSTQTVTVTGDATQNISLVYDLLSAPLTQDVEVSEDEATITPSAAFQMVPLNTTAEQFSLYFKVNVKEGASAGDGLGFRIDCDSSAYGVDNYSYQTGYIDGGFALRIANQWDGRYGIGISAEDYASGKFEVLIIRDGDIYIGYYRIPGAGWTMAGNTRLNVVATRFSMYSWSENVYFTDISFAPTHELVSIRADVAAEHGSVTISGDPIIGENVTLNITPDSGYILQSLMVNGTEMASSVANGQLTISACGTTLLEIEAVFISQAGEGYVVGGSASAVAGASDAWTIPAGTVLTFTGDAVYTAEVGADGAYSVRLPEGEYTVTANGYGSQTITVSGETDADITLRYDLFGSNDNVTISEDESTLTPTSQWNGVPVNTTADQFTLFFKVNLKEGGSSADGIGFKIFADKEYVFQCGYIDGAWRIRITDSDWVGAVIPVNDAEVTQNGFDVLVVYNEGTYTAYYRIAGGAWTYACSVSAIPTKYEMYNWSQDMYFTDVAFAPSLELIAIDTVIQATENGSVTLVGGDYVLGDDVVLRVLPETGYLLQSILVNGTEMASSVAADGTLTIADCGWLDRTVSATFAEAPDETFTVSGTAQAVAGAGDPWAIPDGVVLSFAGEVTQTATIADGKYSVSLAAGVYTVSAQGYGSQTVIVSANTTANILLRYDLFGSNDNVTISEDETTLTPSTQWNGVAVNTTADQFTLYYKVNLKEGGSSADGIGFKFFTDDNDYTFQCGYIADEGAWRLRIVNQWSGVTLSVTDADVVANGIEVMIVYNEGTFTAYYRLTGGEWKFACSMSGTPTKYEMYNWSADMWFSDVAFEPNLNSAPAQN